MGVEATYSQAYLDEEAQVLEAANRTRNAHASEGNGEGSLQQDVLPDSQDRMKIGARVQVRGEEEEGHTHIEDNKDRECVGEAEEKTVPGRALGTGTQGKVSKIHLDEEAEEEEETVRCCGHTHTPERWAIQTRMEN